MHGTNTQQFESIAAERRVSSDICLAFPASQPVPTTEEGTGWLSIFPNARIVPFNEFWKQIRDDFQLRIQRAWRLAHTFRISIGVSFSLLEVMDATVETRPAIIKMDGYDHSDVLPRQYQHNRVTRLPPIECADDNIATTWASPSIPRAQVAPPAACLRGERDATFMMA